MAQPGVNAVGTPPGTLGVPGISGVVSLPGQPGDPAAVAGTPGTPGTVTPPPTEPVKATPTKKPTKKPTGGGGTKKPEPTKKKPGEVVDPFG